MVMSFNRTNCLICEDFQSCVFSWLSDHWLLSCPSKCAKYHLFYVPAMWGKTVEEVKTKNVYLLILTKKCWKISYIIIVNWKKPIPFRLKIWIFMKSLHKWWCWWNTWVFGKMLLFIEKDVPTSTRVQTWGKQLTKTTPKDILTDWYLFGSKLLFFFFSGEPVPAGGTAGQV